MKNKLPILFLAFTSSILSTTFFSDPCVNDITAPLIICPPSVVRTTDPGSCTAVVNAATLSYPTVFDACGVVSVVPVGIPPGYAFPVGVTTITWTASDAAGNSASCVTQTVTVTDAENPTINCPSNITAYTTPGQCNANVNVPLVTASDNCSITSIANSFNAGGANASGTYPLGTTTVTFTATDASGRTASCNVEVNVINSQSPVITLNGSSTVTIEACAGYTELGATASDTCLGDISSSIIIDSSALNPNAVGSYTITYNVTGATQVIRTVNVVDTTIPTITLNGPNPLNIGDCSTFTELGAVATDPCFGDISGSIVIDNSAVNSGVLGSYPVTYNVTDASGNIATQVTRIVNVLDVNIPEITLIGDNPQTLEACSSYVELGATAIDICFGTDISGSLVIDTSALNLGVPGSYDVTYNVMDAFGNSAIEVVRTVDVVDTTIVADAGSDVANAVCTDTSITLAGNAVSGSSTGLWSVTSGQTNGFSFSDATSPTATFIGDVGEVYQLTWSINNPCGISSDSITVSLMGCNALDFDGIDDNITFKNNYNFSGDFSIEVWVKSDMANGNIQTIMSKRESNNQVDGYDLRLVNNYISFNWNSGQSLNSPYQIATNIWHHVAVTYGSGTYKLYIDGIEVNSVGGAVPISNTYDCLVGAMDQTVNPPFKPLNYFDGSLDELRIWDVALSATQIHKMINQEIDNNSGSVKGLTIPLDISGLSWTDLSGYYRMNQSTDLSGGNLVSNGLSGANGKLRYMTTSQAETAPLPYISNANGSWSNSNTWLYGGSQTIPNSLGIDGTSSIDWNIVNTSHDISSGNKDIVLLGLNVLNGTLKIEDTNPLSGHSLRITDYLKIDGILKLVGESQLLQDMGSVVDYAGVGNLHRDQQGTSNLYNYNYWGSPVSLNGSNFKIGSFLYDGSQPVLWTTSYNANSSTTPITLSNRWLYIYENYPANSYASWKAINQNTLVQVGLGFTMKGSGAATSDQNYTFIGKPNNGTITTPISANYGALVGNPYPSAIDANEFIDDNSSSTLGALYFWEHYSSNSTHVLSDYQGGFAVYTKAGGLPAVSPPEISGSGTSSKIPERYIPVAQGFNVSGNATGGTIIFENDQRVFVKEAVTASNNGSIFMRMAGTNDKSAAKTKEEELIKRVRLDFLAPNGAVRPLLLAFVPNNMASDGIDYGYDALKTDDFPYDMAWMIEGEEYSIQGVGDYVESKRYPLKITMSTTGSIEIALHDLENFNPTIDVFVFDSVLDTYTRINDTNYQSTLDAGVYLDRFYLAFSNEGSLSVDDELLQNLEVIYFMKTNELNIKTPMNIDLKKVRLFNMYGQAITSWKIDTVPSLNHRIQIPIKLLSDEVYIVKLETSLGALNKKIIIKH